MPSIPDNYPQSYTDCQRVGPCKLGNNTTLARTSEGNWAVRLHATDVVTFYRDGSVRLDTGGWNTPTTRLRFRACGFNQSAADVRQHGPRWIVQGPVTQEA